MNTRDRLILPHVGLWLFLLYGIISFHFTDVKFAGIKLNEFVALLTIPFLLYSVRRLNLYLMAFIGLFTLLLLITFAFNPFTDFYTKINGLSLLKSPYFISISRYIELIACTAFALVVYKTVRHYLDNGLSPSYIIRKVLSLNLYLSLFFLVVFLLVYFRVLPLSDSTIVYDTTPYATGNPTPRLRGYYVEGGPLGLLYSGLYMLTFFVKGRKWVYRLVFLLVIFCAQSKAGMAGVLAWHFYMIYGQFKHASWFRYVILALLIPSFYLVFTLLISNYLFSIENFEAMVAERRNDYNFVMGRIASLFISPNMVVNNPIFGVGLGNYALVRNDPSYLGILPPVPEWDAPGLGVFVTLLVENGLFGLITFALLLLAIYRRYAPLSRIASRSMVAFLLICILGVQLHFLYIWFFIGMALAAPPDDL